MSTARRGVWLLSPRRDGEFAEKPVLTCPVLSANMNGKLQLMTGGNRCSADCNVKMSSLLLATAFDARRGTAAPLLPPAPEAGERAR